MKYSKSTSAQAHINAIGASLLDIEKRASEIKRLSLELNQAIRKHHALLEKAQAAYCSGQPGGGQVVPFSGGTNKTPVDDPSEPVEP